MFKNFLLSLVFLLLSNLGFSSSKPNILVIIVDDLGYGDLSSYGATDLKSPHIDSLISEGLRFSECFANCPVCSPTRAALLTGRYQELVGVPGVIRTKPEHNWGYLAPSATMLPQALKPLGYHTAAIGKWHLGLDHEAHPNTRGFDHFHGFLGDMMDDYYHHRRHDQHYMRLNQEKVNPKGHATDVFTQWAQSYLTERKDQKDPFFLYLAYNAPHTPIQPPADWLKKVIKREKGITEKRAKLVALIEHMDHNIGKVIATLKETGQWKNTLTIFVSDNGGQINVGANCGNLRGGKQDMYEGGLKVPASATWPGVIKPGTRSDFSFLTMDLFPTAIEAADGTVPNGIEGRSILPLLKSGRQAPFQRDNFFTRREGNQRYMGDSSWALRRGPWKLLKNRPDGPWELFHLENDPLETTDLSKKESQKFRELTTAMRAQIQRGGTVPWQKPETTKRR
ncbi:MAG: sulfatase-like hydrolase/transferase [Akkermansiaceae bacterium]|nr:sulfatase-like hydrolase/transferase [Akkermansiaceae bacterium]